MTLTQISKARRMTATKREKKNKATVCQPGDKARGRLKKEAINYD